MQKQTPASGSEIQQVNKSEEFLVDSSLLDFSLSLSFEERLLFHERARQTIEALKAAGKEIYNESQQSPEDSTRK